MDSHQEALSPCRDGALNGATDDGYLATRAAWLYYNCSMKQAEVARELGVSLNKANRLIAIAQENGTVRIVVEGPMAQCVGLEHDLQGRFGLNFTRVVPEVGRGQSSFDAVGRAVAMLLTKTFLERQHRLIGVGHGRSLGASARFLPRMHVPDLEFVAMLGCPPYHTKAFSTDLIRTLSDQTGGSARLMPAPVYARSVADRSVVMRQASVSVALEYASRATFILLGIGCVAELEASLETLTFLTPSEIAQIRNAGAVSTILGHFFDGRGRLVRVPLNKRVIGLDPEIVRGRQVVGVAGGAHKTAAILSAVRTGLLSGLVTTEPTARRLIESR